MKALVGRAEAGACCSWVDFLWWWSGEWGGVAIVIARECRGEAVALAQENSGSGDGGEKTDWRAVWLNLVTEQTEQWVREKTAPFVLRPVACGVGTVYRDRGGGGGAGTGTGPGWRDEFRWERAEIDAPVGH